MEKKRSDAAECCLFNRKLPKEERMDEKNITALKGENAFDVIGINYIEGEVSLNESNSK